jgi:hypothetical protein
MATQHEHRTHDHREPGDRQIHSVEDYSARRHPEFVVLEIGGELGALLLQTGPELHGVEVEVSPSGQDDHRSHKQVLERSINGHAAYTAVFDGLEAGSYSLWVEGRRRSGGVVVEAGTISELDWRSDGPDTRTGGAAA